MREKSFKRKEMKDVARNEDYVFDIPIQTWKNKAIEEFIAYLECVIIFLMFFLDGRGNILSSFFVITKA